MAAKGRKELLVMKGHAECWDSSAFARFAAFARPGEIEKPPNEFGGFLVKNRSAARYFLPKNRFKFARPFTAMSSRWGSILRQMAAARAMTFTSVVKLSMTTSPW